MFLPSSRKLKTCASFRPLTGISCFESTNPKSFTETFPSPHGDKLFQKSEAPKPGEAGFRPLTGISCFLQRVRPGERCLCFRPLTGISCFQPLRQLPQALPGFRPLTGISCFTAACGERRHPGGFRPLTGISCFQYVGVLFGHRLAFPSPHGDKLFPPCWKAGLRPCPVSVPSRG